MSVDTPSEHGDDASALPRPRSSSWGRATDRAVLQAVAEDLTRRSGFKVCAIEVLRTDQMLEFVAIAGSPGGSERLLGQGSPLESMQVVFNAGQHAHGWVFVAGDTLDDYTRDVMAEYGHRPELVPSDSTDAWLPEDMLFTCLLGVGGDLRAVLYLDEPYDGLRPSLDRVAELQAEVALALDSVVNIVERETFGEQVRMAEAARRVIQEARSRVGVEELLTLVAEELPAGFNALRVGVTLTGEPPEGWDDMARAMQDSFRRIWEDGTELIVDPDRLWGDDDFAEKYGDQLRSMLGAYGITSSVMIPIGIGGEFLGVLSMARGEGMPPWTDSEIRGGRAVAGDIAGALVDARSVQREKELNAQLVALDEYRRSMIRTIAHELQNPVGVLTGHLDLVGMIAMPDMADRSLAAMGRAADRIESMAQNLVTLGRITDAEQPKIEVEIHLSALVHEVLDFVAVLAESGGVTLTGSIAEEQVVVGDPTELHRLVSNLVSNAIKYTPKGGSVEVTLAPGDDAVTFRCADTGIGLSEEDRVRIFEPFFRSDHESAREKPGTGLGLAIVQQVVERHGGTISVESDLGVGTTFVVELPYS
ncbi:MAG: sensor histidine kinase [Nocardioides sp.]|uniref:sensor histidine kinase n=1 Tax=Nocardioides sp. TaxID=35761 RepID=UPI003F07105A